LIDYLKNYAAKHIFGVAVGVIVIIGVRSYMADHDARLLADATVKQSQSRIADLQQQLQETKQAGQAQIAKLQQEKAQVKTPAQAIAALPSVTPAPLNAAPLPDAPSRVSVDALPFYQAMNECKQCSTELATVKAEDATKDEIITEKDVQITALKKKRGFWKTFERTVEIGGAAFAFGYIAHR
jgi:hypothetical protein